MREPEGRFSDPPPCASADERPSYHIVVRPEPGVDGIRALRHILKAMLRGYGLRCTAVTPLQPDIVPPPQIR